jgi:hypothetical protein
LRKKKNAKHLEIITTCMKLKGQDLHICPSPFLCPGQAAPTRGPQPATNTNSLTSTHQGVDTTRYCIYNKAVKGIKKGSRKVKSGPQKRKNLYKFSILKNRRLFFMVL